MIGLKRGCQNVVEETGKTLVPSILYHLRRYSSRTHEKFCNESPLYWKAAILHVGRFACRKPSGLGRSCSNRRQGKGLQSLMWKPGPIEYGTSGLIVLVLLHCIYVRRLPRVTLYLDKGEETKYQIQFLLAEVPWLV